MEHWIFMKLSYIYETFNLFNLRSAFLYCRFHWSGQSFLLLRCGILPHLDPRATVFFQIRTGDRHGTDLRILRDLKHDIKHELLDDRPECSGSGIFL